MDAQNKNCVKYEKRWGKNSTFSVCQENKFEQLIHTFHYTLLFFLITNKNNNNNIKKTIIVKDFGFQESNSIIT